MYNRSTGSIETVAKYVTDRLRNDIISGKFSFGERIRIKQIAEKYNVSAMPTREAFNRLQGENLIEIEQYKGAIIRPMTAKSISDVYDVRRAVEILITSRIAERGISDQEEAKLNEINNSLDFSLSIADLNIQFSEMNDDFHDYLLGLCDNQHAVEVYVSFSRLLMLLKKRYPLKVERIKSSQLEHQEIIEILKTNDVEGAEEIIKRHANNAKEHMLTNFSQK